MKNRYYLQIDLIKAFAIIAVLLMHSFDNILIFINSNVQITPIISTGLTNNSIVHINQLSLLGILGSLKVFTLYQAVPIFFVLMGITIGMSFNRHNYKNLREIYSKNYFKSRFKRLYFPYILLLTFSLIIGSSILIITGKNLFVAPSFLTLIGLLPLKGPNLGYYFVTIVLQVIFIFPMIYVFYQRNSKLTIFASLVIDLSFQLISFYYYNFNSYLFIFRFISALTIGLWISEQNFNLDEKLSKLSKIKEFYSNYKFFITLTVIGIIYLALWYFFYQSYLKSCFYPLPYLNGKYLTFSCQNMFSFVYDGLIIILGLILLPNITKNKIINFMGLIGKASYHIFLIQILFFNFSLFISCFGGQLLINKLVIISCDIIFCIIIGIIFYISEKQIYDYLVNHLIRLRCR